MNHIEHLLDCLPLVFPKWEEMCKVMLPYAEVIWTTGRIPKDEEKYPTLDWEDVNAEIPLFGITGVVGNKGGLKTVRKRGRAITVGQEASKRARSVSADGSGSRQ